jgi:uncharacterized membrane protein
MAVTQTDYWDGRGAVVLWTAVLLAPAAGALDLLISYALVKPACAQRNENLLTLVSAGAFVMVIAGGWLARSCLARLREATEEGGRTIDRSYFMAIGAIALNVLIGILIVTFVVNRFVLSPCE